MFPRLNCKYSRQHESSRNGGASGGYPWRRSLDEYSTLYRKIDLWGTYLTAGFKVVYKYLILVRRRLVWRWLLSGPRPSGHDGRGPCLVGPRLTVHLAGEPRNSYGRSMVEILPLSDLGPGPVGINFVVRAGAVRAKARETCLTLLTYSVSDSGLFDLNHLI